MRPDDYRRGFRHAAREAVAHINALAEEMNDPHARRVLNSAAFSLGGHFSQRSKGLIPDDLQWKQEDDG